MLLLKNSMAGQGVVTYWKMRGCCMPVALFNVQLIAFFLATQSKGCNPLIQAWRLPAECLESHVWLLAACTRFGFSQTVINVEP